MDIDVLDQYKSMLSRAYVYRAFGGPSTPYSKDFGTATESYYIPNSSSNIQIYGNQMSTPGASAFLYTIVTLP
jgi:hypothetical protein